MITEILQQIQTELKAPKNQYNSFGKYNYRNAEDILEALKPILAKYKAVVITPSEIIERNSSAYVECTATLMVGDEKISATAQAREPQTKKGMDEAQITGAANSYAKKYALNSLFAIDDTKDSDGLSPDGSKYNGTRTKPTQDEYVLDADVKRLMKILREKNIAQKTVCEQYNVKSLRHLTMEQYSALCDSLV